MNDSAPDLLEEDVATKYPEVFHYTNAVGLHGILTSQTIWATHAKYLNDYAEVELFFDTRLEALCRKAYLKVDELKTESELCGASKALAQVIKQRTIEFNQPFFFSLTISDTDLDKKDGLLSQWRGYGNDGGYALVFKTHELIEMLKEEKTYSYQFAEISNVHYFDNLTTSSVTTVVPEILKAEEKIVSCLSEILRRSDSRLFEEMYEPVTFLSCVYKDIHFHEEKELRVVAIPSDKQLSLADEKTLKPIKAFPRNGCMIPYIELFSPEGDGGVKKKLPIKRIVVGPHSEKLLRRQALEIWLKNLGIDVEIVVSGISYKG